MIPCGDPGSPCQMMSFRGVQSPPKRRVFRLHETILSFGEPGSLGNRSFVRGVGPDKILKPRIQIKKKRGEKDPVFGTQNLLQKKGRG